MLVPKGTGIPEERSILLVCNKRMQYYKQQFQPWITNVI